MFVYIIKWNNGSSSYIVTTMMMMLMLLFILLPYIFLLLFIFQVLITLWREMIYCSFVQLLLQASKSTIQHLYSFGVFSDRSYFKCQTIYILMMKVLLLSQDDQYEWMKKYQLLYLCLSTFIHSINQQKANKCTPVWWLYLFIPLPFEWDRRC